MRWPFTYLIVINVTIFGINTISPIKIAVIALINTAAAARSFTSFIEPRFSGDTKSESFSIDVFIASEEKTSPIAIITAIHSVADILKAIPDIITNKAEMKCNQELCPLTNSVLIPSKAYLKLSSLALILNFSCFILIGVCNAD